MLALIFENSPLCKPYYLITSRSTIDHEIRCFTGEKWEGRKSRLEQGDILIAPVRFYRICRTFVAFFPNLYEILYRIDRKVDGELSAWK